MSIYDFKATDINGKQVDFAEFKGKVLLIVNTATGCGFTPQYKGLQDLYDKYKDKGLEILDFPCNQFAGQAPGTEQEIYNFCQTKFGVTFRQFAKIKVNGKEAHPLYVYLKEQKHGIMGSRIKWNFTKFLVDQEGNVVERFAPQDKPEDIDAHIAKLLK